MKNVLIMGATSAIAEAVAKVCAQRGDNLYLLGRNQKRLAAIAADLEACGAASVSHEQMEATRFEDHQKLIDQALKSLQRLDLVLIAQGTLPEQKACEADFAEALQALNINALGTLSLLTHLANRLEQQGSGTIAVISSVAGDRGRQSNYLYGAAKSMVSTFLQGLRNRLHKANVKVVDIKPGFIDTPMTASFNKGALWASPKDIAPGIVRALDKGKPVTYQPSFWRWVMFVIKRIPESIFKRLSL